MAHCHIGKGGFCVCVCVCVVVDGCWVMNKQDTFSNQREHVVLWHQRDWILSFKCWWVPFFGPGSSHVSESVSASVCEKV